VHGVPTVLSKDKGGVRLKRHIERDVLNRPWIDGWNLEREGGVGLERRDGEGWYAEREEGKGVEK
jgi:hypothetical protein